MVTQFLTIALFALGAVAMPAAAPIATPAPAKVDFAARSATTAYEATRPSGVPGGGATEVRNASELGGFAWATNGDQYGEVAGTLLYGTEHQAAGHASGAAGAFAGELVGTINDGGFAKGCAGGQVGSEGFTQCLQLPPRAAAATPAP